MFECWYAKFLNSIVLLLMWIRYQVFVSNWMLSTHTNRFIIRKMKLSELEKKKSAECSRNDMQSFRSCRKLEKERHKGKNNSAHGDSLTEYSLALFKCYQGNISNEIELTPSCLAFLADRDNLRTSGRENRIEYWGKEGKNYHFIFESSFWPCLLIHILLTLWCSSSWVPVAISIWDNSWLTFPQ